MLARAAGVDTNTIARLERNEILDLSGARILRLAKALQVSTDMLLGAVELDEPTSEVSPTGTALVGT
jgi:transcriptional regulator with XRE-family HTH domain